MVGLGCAGCSLTVSLPGFTYEVFQGLLGALVWILANATYLDYRREGRPRGFRRLLAFWFGLPTTFLVRLFVPEGRPERLAPDELNAEGEEALLLAEIRAAAVSRTAGRAAGQELAGGHPAEKDDSDDLGDHP